MLRKEGRVGKGEERRGLGEQGLVLLFLGMGIGVSRGF